MPPDGKADYTGRCYCGQSRISAVGDPLTVAYCHCQDCRRISGAPAAAFAAFREAAVTLTPPRNETSPLSNDVRRRFCPNCGTPLTAAFDYLPGQIYVPLGVLDQAGELPPELHCHSDKMLKWLHIEDDSPRASGTARAALLDT